MLLWLISAAAGAGAALALYGRRLPTDTYRRALMALRGIAVLLAVALLLDAPAGRIASSKPLVALDASASWGQGGGTRFAEAQQRAKALDGDLIAFGDSVRAANAEPRDGASRVGPAVDRAAALGRPVTVITDGQLDDAEALEQLPVGSTVEVFAAAPKIDAAVRAIELASVASPGDSLDLRVIISTAGAAVPASTITVRTGDGAQLAAAPLAATEAWSEREWRTRVRVPDKRDAVVLRAIVTANGDVERRNDTLTTILDVRGGPSAVFASTAPDQDSRFAMELMRSALKYGVRGFVRVAPGQWRDDATLAKVEESAVRDALAHAPVAVLHGDTALFGAPRALTHGALALIVPPKDEDGEYFPTEAPASPLTPALSGVPWDSVPPITLGPAPIGTSWTALNARRARRFDDRAVVAGYDAPRRIAVLPVRGVWRWKFRGGRAADAFAALWGGVADWLVQGDADERAARAVQPWLREGDPVTWRRGVTRDSLVTVKLHRDGASSDTSITLRFSDAATTTTTAPLRAGIWRATVAGGSSVFAVNASAEWVPRRPITARAAVTGPALSSSAASLRAGWWWYALVLVLLCAEWFMRRRIGLR